VVEQAVKEIATPPSPAEQKERAKIADRNISA